LVSRHFKKKRFFNNIVVGLKNICFFTDWRFEENSQTLAWGTLKKNPLRSVTMIGFFFSTDLLFFLTKKKLKKIFFFFIIFFFQHIFLTKIVFFIVTPEGKKGQKMGSVLVLFFEFCLFFTEEFSHFLISNFWGKNISPPQKICDQKVTKLFSKKQTKFKKQNQNAPHFLVFFSFRGHNKKKQFPYVN
jgi:hypothetical protein